MIKIINKEIKITTLFKIAWRVFIAWCIFITILSAYSFIRLQLNVSVLFTLDYINDKVINKFVELIYVETILNI